MQSTVMKVDRVIEGVVVVDAVTPAVTADAIVTETTDIVQVMATIQIVVPTERELFCIIIDKIQQLDRSIIEIKKETNNLTNALSEIQKKIPSESSLRYLSVKELTNRYSISESKQKQLRGRVKNSLPYYQDGIGGKIKYKVSEIDEWVKSQKVKRGI